MVTLHSAQVAEASAALSCAVLSCQMTFPARSTSWRTELSATPVLLITTKLASMCPLGKSLTGSASDPAGTLLPGLYVHTTFPLKSVAATPTLLEGVRLTRSRNSTPPWGVAPAVVVAVEEGTAPAGSVPVVNAWSASV